MPNEVHSLRSAGIDERADVVDQFGHAVVAAARGPRSLRVAALVGRQTAVSPCGQPRYNRVPARIELRKAMQQHSHRTVSRTGINQVEDELATAGRVQTPIMHRR